MPRRIVPLSDTQIKKAKSQDKEIKLYDGGGLYLLVTPSGGKLWRLKYSFNGKEKKLSLGSYPDVSLVEVRGLRDDAKSLLKKGVDPGEAKKAQRVSIHSKHMDSLEVVARSWHAANVPRWAESHAKTTMERLEKNVFPYAGSLAINMVTLSECKGVLHRIERRAPESARRMFIALNMIFRYAVATERIDRSPMEGLKPRDVLTTDPIQQHMPAITDPKELGAFLRVADDFRGSAGVSCALRFAPLVFQRPGDDRFMEWIDVDLDAAEWNIPIEKMKLSTKEKAARKGQVHCVPLSRQAVAILKEIQPLTGRYQYVFTSDRSTTKPISEASITAALHRLGYKDVMSWHGFRATARTLLDEVLEFPADIIEHQLAHAVRDALGRAYNRTTKLEQRRKMMQEWADYLDSLKGQ